MRSHADHRRRRLVVLLAMMLAGCSSGVQVRTVCTDNLFRKMKANVLNEGMLSPRTLQYLRRKDLANDFKKEPLQTIRKLDHDVRQQADAEAVFALAEMCCVTARGIEARDKKASMGLYLGAVAYSYFYLFDPEISNGLSTYDPRYRIACDLYNTSLAKVIGLAQRQELRLDEKLHVEFGENGLDIEITRNGFAWKQEDFGRFRFANDYEVQGLTNHYHTYGLGVPLIAERTHDDAQSVQDKYYPREQSFPVTAFLRMNCGVCGAKADNRPATLELYDPLNTQNITVAGKSVPLESDLTTPLGFFLSRAKLERMELTGLLRPEQLQDKTGLFMIQPYEPGKIPVVMIHGLWSSPHVWMQMFNDLRGDPALRDNYQFWFYMYPTGNPIPFSAAKLRETLQTARQQLDPKNDDPAFDKMVLVGHSMGGLLAKMMTQKSESALWDAISNEPPEKLNLVGDESKQIRQVFFFENQPYVKRVVFIATPHRGSPLSQRFIGRLSTRLISLPRSVTAARNDIIARNPNVLKSGPYVMTSVDNLSPKSPFILATSKLPLDDALAYHSIVGDVGGHDLAESSDGVVKYYSSHIDGARSEYVVPATHAGCVSHPLTVAEVRRILVEHYEQQKNQWPVQYAGVAPDRPADATADKVELPVVPVLSSTADEGPK